MKKAEALMRHSPFRFVRLATNIDSCILISMDMPSAQTEPMSLVWIYESSKLISAIPITKILRIDNIISHVTALSVIVIVIWLLHGFLSSSSVVDIFVYLLKHVLYNHQQKEKEGSSFSLSHSKRTQTPH